MVSEACEVRQVVPLWLGPTASGKSDRALVLAERLGFEIISIDSAQVYRALDIGTAKPDAATRARVRHHLIDLIDPDETYSIARFAADCRAALEDIAARSTRALVVGGTMMYADLLLHGMSAVPPTDPAVRAAVAAEAAQRGLPAMHAALARVDPMLAARLPPTDRQRILRGIEVYRMTGRPLSMLQGQRQPLIPGIDFRPLIWWPADRAWLHARCARRLDAMWRAGFVEEVRAVRERFALTLAHPAMRAVGYRQILEGLLAGEPEAEMKARALYATRQLAKRQITWLRALARSADATIVDCMEASALSQVEAWLRALGEANGSSA
ncbi:MAG: tRNA (adenosine(37)-N6)-dimethylallyltransferase MiaA [Casimicrobiaceae bacterium]